MKLVLDSLISNGSRAPGTGRTQTARLWTYAREERPWGSDAPPAAWYRFSGDRKGRHPKDHLADFRGWMHADGYAGFEGLYRSGEIREVACMAHIRRKFVDVHKAQGSTIWGPTNSPCCLGSPERDCLPIPLKRLIDVYIAPDNTSAKREPTARRSGRGETPDGATTGSRLTTEVIHLS